MDDLVRWLGEQLDEDERMAKATTERQPYDEWDAVGAGDDDDAARSHWGVVRIARMAQSPAARSLAVHIARHDPARVLREIDAKRQLLDLHEPGEMEYVDGDVCMACDVRGGEPFYPCKTLRLLALPYADRPGYREEWRP
ncbi:DUF6221 family protein [Streptomyces sp. NPDC058947]|uniref:DUF6221 family protein n=1 Tax=Streptomyces sp. NPDC058947 TaxID=3346675 RepID=UPI0036A196E1